MQKKKQRYLDVPHGFPHTAPSTTGVCSGACNSPLDAFNRLGAELTQSQCMVDIGNNPKTLYDEPTEKPFWFHARSRR